MFLFYFFLTFSLQRNYVTLSKYEYIYILCIAKEGNNYGSRSVINPKV